MARDSDVAYDAWRREVEIADIERRAILLSDRLDRVERLLQDIYQLSNTDTFPPELVERLRDFADNPIAPEKMEGIKMDQPQSTDFVLVSIVEYPDGRVAGMELHRGSQKDCEKTASLIPALRVSEPVTKAVFNVIPAHKWDAASLTR